MTAESPIPTLLAFLISDTVILDAPTQKRTIVGVFDRILSPVAPFPINSIGLYAKMVDGAGSYRIKVRLVNLTKDEAKVMEIEVDARWTNPDEPMELGMNFNGIPLAEFGTYEFQLYANDAYLGRATLRAVKMQPPPVAQR